MALPRNVPLERAIITGCDIWLIFSWGLRDYVLFEHGTVMINKCILVIVWYVCQAAKGWSVLDSSDNCLIPLLLGTYSLPLATVVSMDPGQPIIISNHWHQRLIGPRGGHRSQSKANQCPCMGFISKHWVNKLFPGYYTETGGSCVLWHVDRWVCKRREWAWHVEKRRQAGRRSEWGGKESLQHLGLHSSCYTLDGCGEPGTLVTFPATSVHIALCSFSCPEFPDDTSTQGFSYNNHYQRGTGSKPLFLYHKRSLTSLFFIQIHDDLPVSCS